MQELMLEEYRFGGENDHTYIEISNGKVIICGGDFTVCDACVSQDCDNCKIIPCG